MDFSQLEEFRKKYINCDCSTDYIVDLLFNINNNHLPDNEKNTYLEYASDYIYETVLSSPEYAYKTQLYIAIYSACIYIYAKPDYMDTLANLILEDERVNWQSTYYVFTRFTSTAFLYPRCNTEKINLLIWKLLKKSLERYLSLTGKKIEPIPISELTGNTCVVITSQFLSTSHGPTKTTLDRAYVLSKRYGSALIINTAEILTDIRDIPYIDTRRASYDPNLLQSDSVEWKGMTIPYFQCNQDMPNEPVLDMLLDTIRRLKPSVCVCVGGDSFLAGLVNMMMPVVVVGTVQSNLKATLCDYQIANRYQLETDANLIKELNYEDGIIKGEFTFALKDETHKYTRNDLGLKDDAFVISLIGGRLNTEITDELWNALNNIATQNVQFAFIGGYSDIQRVENKYPNYKGNLINLGYCEDVLAVLRNIDLYVNPIRRGGATSAVEAMSAGVPVVTVDYGDVAGTAGPDFVCSSYDEYETLIRQYMEDPAFYSKQSQLALDKAAVLLDSEREFNRVLDEFLERRAHK